MSIHHSQHCTDTQINHTPAQDSVYINEYMLWKSFKEGDLEAYAVIYRKYFFVLYQYGKKICDDHELVEDGIQNLFIKIWNNRQNLHETTSIKYYLFTALKRKLLDTLRGPQARLQSENNGQYESLLVVEDKEEDEMIEQKEAVLKALNRLSTHQQNLLHLKFYKNLSNQEIAEELGISLQSVYNAVFKTLKSLREQLSMIVLTVMSYLLQ